MSRGAAERGCLVYCGNLPEDIREREVEDLFAKVRADCQLWGLAGRLARRRGGWGGIRFISAITHSTCWRPCPLLRSMARSCP